MKQTVVLSLFIIAAVCITRCTKPDTAANNNSAKCTTCTYAAISHTPDTTGLYYYLPTAFTPNGDLKNDLFYLSYNNKVNVDSSTITIWDINGNGVFEGTVNQHWNGNDTKGNLCPIGHYPLYLKIRTTSGATITTCGCVSIIGYKGTCIYTGGITYYLPDQLDTLNGFVYPTQDNLCP